VPPELGLRRNKRLRVRHAGRDEIALVDVCVARQPFLGARAVWQPADLRHLFVAFAEPRAIGLTAIAAWATPVARADPWGAWLRFGPGRARAGRAAPGLVERVELAEVARLWPDTAVALPPGAGTVALDGERELELQPAAPLSVALEPGGPLTIDVDAVLAHAASRGLLHC
jgi:hypothetical protein